MIVAGCDIGSATVKAVVLDERRILGFEVAPVGGEAVRSASQAMGALLDRLGLTQDDVDYCVSTGYGRRILPFADDDVSEVSCHGRGAKRLAPAVATVIDGGGQDCKVILVDQGGQAREFGINLKCSAGTGRGIELMSDSLGVPVSELGALALRATDPPLLREPCAVTAALQVRLMILRGVDPSDIAASICNYVALRILALVRNVGGQAAFAITGGIAKNPGVVGRLEAELGERFVRFPHDPQIVGALGAALFAADRFADGARRPGR